MTSQDASSQLYNKPEHRHTLVGNWQEEEKLLETTGTHRYKVSELMNVRSLQNGFHDMLHSKGLNRQQDVCTALDSHSRPSLHCLRFQTR